MTNGPAVTYLFHFSQDGRGYIAIPEMAEVT